MQYTILCRKTACGGLDLITYGALKVCKKGRQGCRPLRYNIGHCATGRCASIDPYGNSKTNVIANQCARRCGNPPGRPLSPLVTMPHGKHLSLWQFTVQCFLWEFACKILTGSHRCAISNLYNYLCGGNAFAVHIEHDLCGSAQSERVSHAPRPDQSKQVTAHGPESRAPFLMSVNNCLKCIPGHCRVKYGHQKGCLIA